MTNDKERQEITSKDVGNALDLVVDALDGDPFKGYQPLPGAEEFGRCIVDANGVPSGSPANYEYLRGSAPGALTGEALEQAISEAITAAATSVAPPASEADK